MTGKSADKSKKRPRIYIGFKQSMMLILPYLSRKIKEQIKSVWLLIFYLLLFQILVLRIPVVDGIVVSCGIVMVIAGLTFFMEGLLLGLMPLGEYIGIKLPQKSGTFSILIFALILGIGVTFAEPAIGVLKAAGASVLPWNAPLLYTMLNSNSHFLVYAVSAGVGLAVMISMLRFLYSVSLKPLIYITILLLIILTLTASADSNLSHIISLAWDCGGITTGPVTVPLVLSLGLGICRIVSSGSSSVSGFGIVTMASLFPVLTVLLLGFHLNSSLPEPMPEKEFFSLQNRNQVQKMFRDKEEFTGFALKNTSEENQAQLFKGGVKELYQYIFKLTTDTQLCKKVFGDDPDALLKWAETHASPGQKELIFNTVEPAHFKNPVQPSQKSFSSLFLQNMISSAKAIIPLSVFLLMVLIAGLREKLRLADEVLLGIFFAFTGMIFFNIGIETGLGKLGGQVGKNLPVLFKSIPVNEQIRHISNFDKSLVQTALTEEGRHWPFFYIRQGNNCQAIPFDEKNYDPDNRCYTFLPFRGPLFGRPFTGLVILLFFSFIMGYGATLAEPALNALGYTVENITVGAFKKELLIQSVAVGVGLGITFGIVKIILGLPLTWLLIPPYVFLLILTWFSSEDYVNVAWDSAGVTTGPVTVPLILAMGLGISSAAGSIEGFGILAMASVYPILTVLLTGIFVSNERAAELKDTSKE